jgi:hypothetical protein
MYGKKWLKLFCLAGTTSMKRHLLDDEKMIGNR